MRLKEACYKTSVERTYSVKNALVCHFFDPIFIQATYMRALKGQKRWFNDKQYIDTFY